LTKQRLPDGDEYVYLGDAMTALRPGISALLAAAAEE